MNKIIKSVAISTGISLAIFVTIGIVFDIIYKGNFSLEHYYFTKMAVGTLLCGLGFGVPSIVYENEKLPLPMQFIIHMGTGCLTYTAVAFLVGWIPVNRGLIPCIISLAGELFLALIIWLGFLKYYKNLARKMNEKLQKLE